MEIDGIGILLLAYNNNNNVFQFGMSYNHRNAFYCLQTLREIQE